VHMVVQAVGGNFCSRTSMGSGWE